MLEIGPKDRWGVDASALPSFPTQLTRNDTVCNVLDVYFAGLLTTTATCRSPSTTWWTRWPSTRQGATTWRWVKMAQNVDGDEVHYSYNSILDAYDDFKFP